MLFHSTRLGFEKLPIYLGVRPMVIIKLGSGACS